MMQITKHFTLEELTRSDTAVRFGIDNEPGSEETENLVRVCDMILEPIRHRYDTPILPSSGYRCLELNRKIGSSDKSQHTKGQAVDFEVKGVPNMEVASWIMDNLDYDQLILEFYKEDQPNSGWIHCSYVGNENRNESKRFDGSTWNSLP
tara:strand:+ start:155 stop:604 length:450 start_codon:yes stop_codon:yes gene_type:complete